MEDKAKNTETLSISTNIVSIKADTDDAQLLKNQSKLKIGSIDERSTKESDINNTVSEDKKINMIGQDDDSQNTDNKTESEEKQPLSKTESKLISRQKKREKRMRFQPKNVLGKTLERSNFHEEFLHKSAGEEVPYRSVIMPQKLIADHFEEIKSMLNAVKQHSGSKTAMQLLPSYLRRRAASHNAKRLPRNLRDLAKAQMQSPEEKKKTIYRKCRRRKIDLQNEYAKRKGKQGWLETHLWHAKRFRMSEEKEAHYSDWGCRVALKSYQKSFRPSYRAIAKHCAVQESEKRNHSYLCYTAGKNDVKITLTFNLVPVKDISFMKCLQLGGNNQDLFDALSSLTLPNEIPRLKTFLTGCLKERELLLYDLVSNQLPRCVGPVRVMFTPMDEDKSRRVWMWMHPILLKKVTSMLEKWKEKHEITIEDISATLNRFRLTGPKSSVTLLAVLRSFQHFKQSSSEEIEAEASDLEAWLAEHKTLIQKQHSVFVSAMKDCHNRHFHTEAVQSSAPLCNPGDVLSLLANDPRLTLPVNRSNPSLDATAELTKHDDVSEFRLNLLRKSPLWVTSLRAEVSASRLPDHVVSTRKHETKLCVGKELKKLDEEMATPVPVAMIRRGGYRIRSDHVERNSDDPPSGGTELTEAPASEQPRTVHGGPLEGFGSGWDVIVPSNWGMAFWVPFVYQQAKPIGMELHCHGRLEYKTPTFPQDYPDTEAGLNWWMSELQTNHHAYYKRPPAKRPNFALLATRYPFAPCWKHLFQNDSSPQSEEVKANTEAQYEAPIIKGDVLVSDDLITDKPNNERNSRKRPHSDDDADEPVSKTPKIDNDYKSFLPFVLRNKNKLEQLDKLIKSGGEDDVDFLASLISEHRNTLVCMKLSPINRGVPAPQTSISLPESEDLDKLQEEFCSLYNNGLKDCFGPKEKKHWDPYRKQRKEATKAAKKNRKRKSDKRVKIERNYPHIFDVPASRKVVGYVTSGNYLFSFATGGGIAFVSLDALPELISIKRKRDWVSSFMRDTLSSSGLLSLMRNIDSEQYRFITLDLIVPS